jgi:ATP synthase protein I
MFPSDNNNNNGRYVNLAIMLPLSTFVGYLIGYGLDKLFHTTWLAYVFLVIGAIAGFVDAFRTLLGDQNKGSK